MPDFVFIYHGGNTPETPDAGQAVMAEWGVFYDKMGNAVSHGGGPVGMSKTVSSSGTADDGGSNPVSGLTIVTAASMDDAVTMAQGCPMVKDGSGSVEVAEIIEM